MAKLPKNKYGKGCTVYGNDKKDVSLSDVADYVECNRRWFIASTVKGQHILFGSACCMG